MFIIVPILPYLAPMLHCRNTTWKLYQNNSPAFPLWFIGIGLMSNTESMKPALDRRPCNSPTIFFGNSTRFQRLCGYECAKKRSDAFV